MTDQHPAVTFLLAAHERAEGLAGKATKGPWTVKPVVYGAPEDGWGEPSNWEIEAPGGTVVSHQNYEGGGIGVQADADHIALHNPVAVLARVAAERGILAEHDPDAEDFCRICMAFTGVGARYDCAPHPCCTVLGLAKAWGWKEANDG